VKRVAACRHAGDGGDEHLLGAGGDQPRGVGDAGRGDVDIPFPLGDELVVHAAQGLVEIADVPYRHRLRL